MVQYLGLWASTAGKFWMQCDFFFLKKKLKFVHLNKMLVFVLGGFFLFFFIWHFQGCLPSALLLAWPALHHLGIWVIGTTSSSRYLVMLLPSLSLSHRALNDSFPGKYFLLFHCYHCAQTLINLRGESVIVFPPSFLPTPNPCCWETNFPEASYYLATQISCKWNKK